MKKQIEQFNANLSTLSAFVAKYGDKIPDELCYISASCSTLLPSLALRLGHSSADREKALLLYSEVFGREGWESEESSVYRNRFDWQKTVDGVAITIGGAEVLPDAPRRVPVPPSKFPIQLEDVK